MKINIKEVEQLANLARIELFDEEKNLQLEKLNNILDNMDILKELNTDNIEPLVDVLPSTNVFRTDEVQETLEIEVTLQNGPEVAQGMFRVPKIV